MNNIKMMGSLKALNDIFCEVCGAIFWSMEPINLKHHVMVKNGLFIPIEC